MADNNGSNNVAIIAIIIVLVGIFVAVWYFRHDAGVKRETESASIQVTLPPDDSDSNSEKK